MKRNSIVALLIAGLVLVAGAAPAIAEWDASASSENGLPATDHGTYEIGPPMETGKLVMNDARPDENSGVSESVEKYDSGGLVFRKGIDDGP